MSELQAEGVCFVATKKMTQNRNRRRALVSDLCYTRSYEKVEFIVIVSIKQKKVKRDPRIKLN